MTAPIRDSELTKEEILRQNPLLECPAKVLDEIAIVNVNYYSFDGNVHSGQLAVHKKLADDVEGAFKIILEDKFPIESVIPVSDKRFEWDDTISTSANNTSAFNYRFVRGTEEISAHAFGRAIDINPRLNPYFPGKKVFPVHSSYNPEVEGTILAQSRLVEYFKDLGWRWGGDWNEDLDFQHFEKPED